MRPWILGGLGALALLFGLGVLITMVPKRRVAAEQESCKNNLKSLSLFAAHHAKPPKDLPADKLRNEIPAGTIVLPGVAPESRLSWLVDTLPGLDQRRQDTAAVLAAIDRTQPWTSVRNQTAARTRLVVLLCPGNPAHVDPEQPAPTQYVGIAGLGVDAATLNFFLPAPAPPRAGCFHYDSPTPFASITDGLSQTLLFGERSTDLGSWLRGGPSTVRGLDDRPDSPPLIGAGGQFGGNHFETSNWAIADGSVRSFTPRVDRGLLFGMATIAGKDHDVIPGE